MYTIEHELQELIRVLDPSVAEKANRAALKGVRGKVATATSRSVRKHYNVTARRVSEALQMGMRKNNSEAWLEWTGNRISLIHFTAKFRRVNTASGKRMGATVRIHKGKSRMIVKGGFIAAGQNSNVRVFKRKGDARLPVVSLHGPSVPQMIENRETHDDVGDVVSTEFPQIFANKAQFYLDRLFR